MKKELKTVIEDHSQMETKSIIMLLNKPAYKTGGDNYEAEVDDPTGRKMSFYVHQSYSRQGKKSPAPGFEFTMRPLSNKEVRQLKQDELNKRRKS
ncbi:MAG: hypothetical protein ISR65_18515 [Bacteriovoracaceae bacterium]|nr:hypothetical protein [candidate division KSB1 bacterium]MBL6991782.1 hypothetical protein [Bacteriovoracaceae bacterium]